VALCDLAIYSVLCLRIQRKMTSPRLLLTSPRLLLQPVVAESKDIPQQESQKEQKDDNGSIPSDSFSKNRAFNRPSTFDSLMSGGSQGRRSSKPKSKIQIEPVNLEDDKDDDGPSAPADETRPVSSKNRAVDPPETFDSPMSRGSQGRRSSKPKSIKVQIEAANLEDDKDKDGPSASADATRPPSSKNQAVDPPATFDSPMSRGSLHAIGIRGIVTTECCERKESNSLVSSLPWYS
jgi:hypothetical protein